jgi:hypothetical protein
LLVTCIQECIVEEWSEKDTTDEAPKSKSSKKDKANAQDTSDGFCFKISNKVSYKTVVKGVNLSLLSSIDVLGAIYVI